MTNREVSATTFLTEIFLSRARNSCATMYFMLRGLPFIYQGQEIGMENLTFTSIDQVDDISSIDEYHVALDAGLHRKRSSRLCLQIQP